MLAKEKQGHTLELVAFDGKLFTFVSPRAFAPGQPLVVEVELGVGHTLDLKSIGSKKRDDGSFEVRARASTLTKATREALASAFGV